jgi:hypothetical protein
MTTLRKFGVLLVVLAVGSVAFTGGALADADASADDNEDSTIDVTAYDNDLIDSDQNAVQSNQQTQINSQSQWADSDNTADDRRGRQISDVSQDADSDQDADGHQWQRTSTINVIFP